MAEFASFLGGGTGGADPVAAASLGGIGRGSRGDPASPGGSRGCLRSRPATPTRRGRQLARGCTPRPYQGAVARRTRCRTPSRSPGWARPRRQGRLVSVGGETCGAGTGPGGPLAGSHSRSSTRPVDAHAGLDRVGGGVPDKGTTRQSLGGSALVGRAVATDRPLVGGPTGCRSVSGGDLGRSVPV